MDIASRAVGRRCRRVTIARASMTCANWAIPMMWVISSRGRAVMHRWQPSPVRVCVPTMRFRLSGGAVVLCL